MTFENRAFLEAPGKQRDVRFHKGFKRPNMVRACQFKDRLTGVRDTLRELPDSNSARQLEHHG